VNTSAVVSSVVDSCVVSSVVVSVVVVVVVTIAALEPFAIAETLKQVSASTPVIVIRLEIYLIF
jgi:hypothetical protein